MNTPILHLASLNEKCRIAVESFIAQLAEVSSSSGFGTYGLEISFHHGVPGRIRKTEEVTIPTIAEPTLRSPKAVPKRVIVKRSVPGCSHDSGARLNA